MHEYLNFLYEKLCMQSGKKHSETQAVGAVSTF